MLRVIPKYTFTEDLLNRDRNYSIIDAPGFGGPVYFRIPYDDYSYRFMLGKGFRGMNEINEKVANIIEDQSLVLILSDCISGSVALYKRTVR